jgi:hypothetical protein
MINLYSTAAAWEKKRTEELIWEDLKEAKITKETL